MIMIITIIILIILMIIGKKRLTLGIVSVPCGF